MDWIRISDKTPDKGQECLFYWRKYVCRGTFVYKDEDEPTACFYDPDPNVCKNRYGVEFWMPIPHPPNDE